MKEPGERRSGLSHPRPDWVTEPAAGKSNILEALALLSRLASQPIDEAFRHGRYELAIERPIPKTSMIS
jgi:hypothetical protein